MNMKDRRIVETVYQAPGLLEWRMTLRAGKATMAVSFTEGHTGANGMTPARFVTTNPAISRMMERSPEFRSGRVVKVSERRLDD